MPRRDCGTKRGVSHEICLCCFVFGSYVVSFSSVRFKVFSASLRFSLRSLGLLLFVRLFGLGGEIVDDRFGRFLVDGFAEIFLAIILRKNEWKNN